MLGCLNSIVVYNMAKPNSWFKFDSNMSLNYSIFKRDM